MPGNQGRGWTLRTNAGQWTDDQTPETPWGARPWQRLAVLGDDGVTWGWFRTPARSRTQFPDEGHFMDALQNDELGALWSGINPTSDEMLWIGGPTAEQLEEGLALLNRKARERAGLPPKEDDHAG